MRRSRASRTTSHSTLIGSIPSKSSSDQFFFGKKTHRGWKTFGKRVIVTDRKPS
jgi:hypothetical protein